MTELDAILKAVCESPHDDTPRLCFADAVEDTDPARSEFVRVQVELASICTPHRLANLDGIDMYLDPDDSDQQEWKHRSLTLRRRESYLLSHHWHEWSGRRFTYMSVSGRGFEEGASGVGFDRGFVNRIACSWSDFLRVADALIWRAWQRCPVCKDGVAQNFNYATSRWVKVKCKCCKQHGGTGRVPRPFPPTAQPITRVTLTTMPGTIVRPEETVLRIPTNTGVGDGYSFDRVNCEACHGLPPRIISDPHKQCPDCHGTPKNEWRCEKWLGVTFKMPTTEPIRGMPPMYDFQNIRDAMLQSIAGGLSVPAAILHSPP